MKIQLRKQFFPDGSIKRIQYKIKEYLVSEQMTLGKNVRLFEEDFSKYLNMKYTVAVLSATVELHLYLV